MDQSGRDVRFVTKADIPQCSKIMHYSITSSAMESRQEGAGKTFPGAHQ
jgi:hypothetical protein